MKRANGLQLHLMDKPHWAAASEADLLAAALVVGAEEVPGWSRRERALVKGAQLRPASDASMLRDSIRQGEDPLGSAFCCLRSPVVRRELGATYTPAPIVRAMLAWAVEQGPVRRVIDPGSGSGRFLLEAGRRFPDAQLIGVEIDPLAAILTRATLAGAGFAHRTRVILGDYRAARLPPRPAGRTLFVGNPPYVRHHLLSPEWKSWLTREAAGLGHPASQLAGLHVHFFLATALLARPGDLGVFITAAEWLDVNYGQLVRNLFSRDLGGRALVVIEPTVMPFPDAASTAVIATFEVHSKAPTVSLKRAEDLSGLARLEDGRPIGRERLQNEPRWSHLTRVKTAAPEGYVELGELCRVHRGQVTGANRFWIAGQHSAGLPRSVLFATVTRARELFEAGDVLTDPATLRRVIDLPTDLSEFEPAERAAIERFLKQAQAVGADQSYIARARKAWWSVGLREPAPILATYMARRPPAFVRNLASARHINIAHGLYPRISLDSGALKALAEFLSRSTTTVLGRTYAGGLTKFEPREMERIPVPRPELLSQLAS